VGVLAGGAPGDGLLLPPPRAGTITGADEPLDYGRNPYVNYEAIQSSVTTYEDIHPMTIVLGITHEGVARAYPSDAFASEPVVNDTVGGLPIVVIVAPGATLVGFERTVDGRTLSFAAAGPRHLRAGGSRWQRADGLAVDGPHAGTRLRAATAHSLMYFFAWRNFEPETEIYGHKSA